MTEVIDQYAHIQEPVLVSAFDAATEDLQRLADDLGVPLSEVTKEMRNAYNVMRAGHETGKMLGHLLLNAAVAAGLPLVPDEDDSLPIAPRDDLIELTRKYVKLDQQLKTHRLRDRK